jgi:aldose 1-epimerase
MKALVIPAMMILVAPSLAAAGCTVEKARYGTLSSGQTVDAWTIRDKDLSVTVLSLGGILYRVDASDRTGKTINVVRNLDSLAAYEKRDNFSSLIGRYAGRISGGGFALDGQRFELKGRPDGVVSHGGPKSFGSRVWTTKRKGCGVELSLTSPDGDNGFPGTVRVRALYKLKGPDLTLSYRATTDKPTVLNLTHHVYFNLSEKPDVFDQRLQIAADQWLPTDDKRVPTGDILPVTGALDLRQGTRIGDVVNADDASIRLAKGLDHSFILNGAPAARLNDPASGRTLTVTTTEPAVVVFTANSFDGSLKDSEGRPLVKGAGIALETQHHPDAPNRPGFPSTVLRPGKAFTSRTTFSFGVE